MRFAILLFAVSFCFAGNYGLFRIKVDSLKLRKDASQPDGARKTVSSNFIEQNQIDSLCQAGVEDIPGFGYNICFPGFVFNETDTMLRFNLPESLFQGFIFQSYRTDDTVFLAYHDISYQTNQLKQLCLIGDTLFDGSCRETMWGGSSYGWVEYGYTIPQIDSVLQFANIGDHDSVFIELFTIYFVSAANPVEEQVGTKNHWMFHCYPNPFNPTVSIEIGEQTWHSSTTLKIFDACGNLVKDLSPAIRTSSSDNNGIVVTWTPPNLPDGIYLCVLKTRNGKQVKRIVLAQ